MATAGPLPHGLEVLDPLFQRMRAHGLAPREAQRRIFKALKREELVILRHVAAGAWSLQPRGFATREEAAQAEQAARAARQRWDHDAANAIVYEQSPSPDGIIEPIVPEIWGVTVILAIRDGHLVIEFLAPTFSPESYTFAIATPKAVDKLLANASVQPASLPLERQEGVQTSSLPSSPAAAPQSPLEWMHATRRIRPRRMRPKETHRAWAKAMISLMEDARKAGQVETVWSLPTMERRLREP